MKAKKQVKEKYYEAVIRYQHGAYRNEWTETILAKNKADARFEVLNSWREIVPGGHSSNARLETIKVRDYGKRLKICAAAILALICLAFFVCVLG